MKNNTMSAQDYIARFGRIIIEDGVDLPDDMPNVDMSDYPQNGEVGNYVDVRSGDQTKLTVTKTKEGDVTVFTVTPTIDGSSSSIRIIPVTTLPVNPEEGVIYLKTKTSVSEDDADQSNYREEYVWYKTSQNDTGHWEKVGDTSINLENYVTFDDLEDSEPGGGGGGGSISKSVVIPRGKLRLYVNDTSNANFLGEFNPAVSSSIVIPIPEGTSDLDNDAGFITANQVPRQVQADWDQNDTTAVDYIKNKPNVQSVPTNVSAFNNDAGYLTEHQSLDGYATTSQIPEVGNGTLTIRVNGTETTFSANQDSNAVVDIDTSASGQVQPDWDESDSSSMAYIQNKPTIPTGDYNDLTNKPTIPAAQVNSDWNANSGVAQILNKPNLATVAESGSYEDLTDKPTIPAAQVNSDWNSNSGVSEILNKPTFAQVATSGSYNDLTDKPTIPNAQVNSDWNSNSGVSQILNKPELATVATTGSYNDLTDKPTIPSSIQQVQSDWDETNTASNAYIRNKPTIQNFNGLKQVDLSTYDGPIGEIVQHVGPDISDYCLVSNNDHNKIKHSFVYERIDDNSSAMEDGGLYVCSIDWNVNKNSSRVGETYGEYPDPYQFLALHPLPYKIVGMKQVYVFGDDNQRVYADRVIATTPRVYVGDQVLVGFGAARVSTVTSADSTEFDTDYTWGHGVGNYHEPTLNSGEVRYLPIFEDANGNQFVTTYFRETSSSLADFKAKIDQLATGYYDSSFAPVVSEDLQTVLLQYVFIKIVDVDVYPGRIYPKWKRVNMQPRHNFAVCYLDSESREKLGGSPLRYHDHVFYETVGWSGGQYEPLSIDSVVDYYRYWLNDVETEEYPYLIAVNNAGAAVDNGPLYVKTTAKGNTVITTIPYGYAGIFTRAKGDSEYFPLIVPGTSTITEYELSELAQGSSSGYYYDSSNSGYSY